MTQRAICPVTLATLMRVKVARLCFRCDIGQRVMLNYAGEAGDAGNGRRRLGPIVVMRLPLIDVIDGTSSYLAVGISMEHIRL